MRERGREVDGWSAREWSDETKFGKTACADALKKIMKRLAIARGKMEESRKIEDSQHDDPGSD
jgi:hypothetical protein